MLLLTCRESNRIIRENTGVVGHPWMHNDAVSILESGNVRSGLSFSPCIKGVHSHTNHARPSSRVLKAGNSRREKRPTSSENHRGSFSVPKNADFLTKGLSKTAVSFETRMASAFKDAPVKSVSSKTELSGRVVTTSGSARRNPFDLSSRTV
jgi:hypothetical protein